MKENKLKHFHLRVNKFYSAKKKHWPAKRTDVFAAIDLYFILFPPLDSGIYCCNGIGAPLSQSNWEFAISELQG